MVEQFYGVNIAVKDLDAGVKKYGAILGVPAIPFQPADFAFPGLKGVSFHLGDVSINIISSDNPETPVYKFVENRGEGVFLISLRVDNLEKAMQDLTANGVKLVSYKPLPYSSGKVNFGHPKSLHGVQIEFIQPDK